ncbi:Probable O-methyltransferase 3 [Linum perenne]
MNNMEAGNLLGEMSEDELLEAQAHCWNYSFNYIVTMSLKCAVELHIPDAIRRHGGPMSLSSLISTLPLHPSKTDALRRLLRLLIQAGFFSTTLLLNGEHQGALTPNLFLMTEPKMMTSWTNMSWWFLASDDPVPYDGGHDGVSFWECLEKDPEQKKVFLDSMAGDSNVVARVLVSDKERLFEGVGTVVDVGGGTGGLAVAIAKKYPDVKCVLFDRPHVVESVEDDVGNFVVVGGDMLEDPIPHADVVLLKILKNCREAVSTNKDKLGKVIIIDMVVDTKKLSQVQLCFDILMLATFNGKERDEEEWKSLFAAAGFNGYKIVRDLGPRSVIEAYP